MKIEVGKFYKTRKGRKARIYATNGGSDYPIHGAIFNNNVWNCLAWSATGNLFIHSHHDHDLVSEWRDEPLKVEMRTVVDEAGKVCTVYSAKEEAEYLLARLPEGHAVVHLSGEV